VALHEFGLEKLVGVRFVQQVAVQRLFNCGQFFDQGLLLVVDIVNVLQGLQVAVFDMPTLLLYFLNVAK
jgi:hypothetical protein